MSTFQRCMQQLKSTLQDEFQIFAILPAITGITTILLCYVVAVDYKGHIPAYFSLPEVSLLGARDPEHTIYQVGVCITFVTVILFYFSFGYFLNNIRGAETLYCSKFFLKGSILTLGIGLLCQGLICLSRRRLRHLHDGNFLDYDHWHKDIQSVIHRIFASILFFSAIIHQLTAIQFYFRALPTHIYSKWFKLWITVIGIVCVTGIVLFRQIDGYHDNPQIESISLHYSGIFEWITVFCMLIFFASYAIDFRTINMTQTSYSQIQETQIRNEEQSTAHAVVDTGNQQINGQ
eukprot:388518_1